MDCWRREISGALRPIWGIILGGTWLPDTERGGASLYYEATQMYTQIEGCNYGGHSRRMCTTLGRIEVCASTGRSSREQLFEELQTLCLAVSCV